jgi:alpha-1,3-rhamnosyl/mannosyltransferase
MFPTRLPSVVTIHDIRFLTHPEFLEPGWVGRLSSRVLYAVENAEAILADTAAMAEMIGDAYHIERSRIHVVPCAATELPAPSPGHPGAPGAVIAVGTLEASKNLPRLIRAHQLLSPDVRREHPLVIIGAGGSGSEAVYHAIDGDAFIRVETSVSPGDLAAFYANAAVLAQVSLCEGFGIPPVEAMVAQLPTLVADLAVLREVTADRAAWYVDPYDVDAICEGLGHVLSIDRASYVVEPPDYSWGKSAAALEAVIDQVAPLS